MESNSGPLNTYDPNSWIRLQDQSGRVSIAPVDGEPTFRDVADSRERGVVSPEGLRQGMESMRGDVENDFEITIADWRDIVGPNNGLDVDAESLSDFTSEMDGLDDEAEECIVEWNQAIGQIDDDEDIDFGPRGPKEPAGETPEPSLRLEEDGGHQIKSKRDREDEPVIIIDSEDTTQGSGADAEADMTLDQPVEEAKPSEEPTPETVSQDSQIIEEQKPEANESKPYSRIPTWERLVPEHRQGILEVRGKITDLTKELQSDPDNDALKRDLKEEVKRLGRYKENLAGIKDDLIGWKKEAGEDTADLEMEEVENDDETLIAEANLLIEPAKQSPVIEPEAVKPGEVSPPKDIGERAMTAETLQVQKLTAEKSADTFQNASSAVWNVNNEFGHTQSPILNAFIKPHEMEQYGRSLHYLGEKMKERAVILGRDNPEDLQALDQEISAVQAKVGEWNDYYEQVASGLSEGSDWREQNTATTLFSAVRAVRDSLKDTEIHVPNTPAA